MQDEGEAYGKLMQDAGVAVTVERYLAVPHTFLHFGSMLSESRRAQADILDAMRRALSRPLAAEEARL